MNEGVEQRVPHWEPRVSPRRVEELYRQEAAGVVDQALLEDVAFGLLARCRDILESNEAAAGRPKCHGCQARLEMALDAQGSPVLNQEVRCPACGWQVTWAEYFRSLSGKKLRGCGALPVFREFVWRMESSSPAEWMMHIDWLMHQFHKDVKGRRTHSVMTNVLAGKAWELEALLERLAAQGIQNREWERRAERPGRREVGTEFPMRGPRPGPQAPAHAAGAGGDAAKQRRKGAVGDAGRATAARHALRFAGPLHSDFFVVRIMRDRP